MVSSTLFARQTPQRRWLIGFCFLGILTTVVDVYVLGILPLSLVAPFAGLTIVFTLLIASSGARARRPSVPPPGCSPPPTGPHPRASARSLRRVDGRHREALYERRRRSPCSRVPTALEAAL